MSTERTFGIRKATKMDLESIARLFDGYRCFYEQSSDLEAARRFIAARLEIGDSVLFVAEQGDTLVGFTQLYPCFSSVSMKRIWILNDLFVDPEQRRSGVGDALMEAAEEFALKDGARGLRLSTQQTNRTAKRLYEARKWTLDTVFDHYHRYF